MQSAVISNDVCNFDWIYVKKVQCKSFTVLFLSLGSMSEWGLWNDSILQSARSKPVLSSVDVTVSTCWVLYYELIAWYLLHRPQRCLRVQCLCFNHLLSLLTENFPYLNEQQHWNICWCFAFEAIRSIEVKCCLHMLLFLSHKCIINIQDIWWIFMYCWWIVSAAVSGFKTFH